MKKNSIITLFLTTVLLCGCDSIYVIKFNNNIKKKYVFTCGEYIINARTIMWKDYHIIQKIYINKPMIVNQDSLRIMLNNDSAGIIRKRIYLNQKEMHSKQETIIDSADVDIVFSVAGHMKYSDSLKIIMDNFLECQNINMVKDTLLIKKEQEYVIDNSEGL